MGDADATAANFGFMDMVLALKWIQNNIHSFSGDRERVTIFGQSSGGTAVFALLASPQASGLFHRAYSLSGSARMDANIETTRKHNLNDPELFVQRSKCASDVGQSQELYSCLSSLSLDEVVAAAPPMWDALEETTDEIGRTDLPLSPDGAFNRLDSFGWAGHYAPLAVLDGDFLPMESSIAEYFQGGGGNTVPTIVGVMAEELDMDALLDVTFPSSHEELRQQLAAHLKWRFGSVDAALTVLDKVLADPWYTIGTIDGGLAITAERAYARFTSDLNFRCPNGALAGALVAGREALDQNPVYHVVTNQGPGPGGESFSLSLSLSLSLHAPLTSSCAF